MIAVTFVNMLPMFYFENNFHLWNKLLLHIFPSICSFYEILFHLDYPCFTQVEKLNIFHLYLITNVLIKHRDNSYFYFLLHIFLPFHIICHQPFQITIPSIINILHEINLICIDLLIPWMLLKHLCPTWPGMSSHFLSLYYNTYPTFLI